MFLTLNHICLNTISKAQCKQLLAFLNACCNSGENHHAANVSTGNGLANLVFGAVDVCSSAGVPATAGVATTNPHSQAHNNYLETMSGCERQRPRPIFVGMLGQTHVNG